MKDLKTKPLIFYKYKTIVPLIAISFTIWLNLHTTVDPSSTLQWKEKKEKEKESALFVVLFLQHSLHCLEPTAPIGSNTWKIKESNQIKLKNFQINLVLVSRLPSTFQQY